MLVRVQLVLFPLQGGLQSNSKGELLSTFLVSGLFLTTYRIASQVRHLQFRIENVFGLFDGLLTFANGTDERPLGLRQHARHFRLLDLQLKEFRANTTQSNWLFDNTSHQLVVCTHAHKLG